MKISWKWISELVDTRALGSIEKCADLLTSRGLEVEAIEHLGQGFEKVISAQILERNKHPQADKLSICKVTTGSGEPLQIVCGAQNMKAGDKVALAQIGALLPNGLKIEKSKIRGEESFGMLCSEEELKLKEESEGILILPAATKLGLPLAEILGRNDSVLVLKLTANRGDCMSHWGIAREIASALGVKLERTKVTLPDFNKKSPISVHCEAGELGPQFLGCYMEGVKVGPSPQWLVTRLETLGTRSINNVVDASNLVLLELGHPTHAYDATQIKGSKLSIRLAKEGEQLPLLDGQTVKLVGTELVIGDAERAVGLAGVMGGGNSEVQPQSTKIFLECAEFDAIRTRKTAFKHQRRTEAAQRYEKGVDPAQLPYALGRLAGLITELAGGRVVGYACAQSPSRKELKKKVIRVAPSYFEEFLGMQVSADKAQSVLEGLGCKVVKDGAQFNVEIPTFRLDLTIAEDLAEEVARTLGYDQIAETIPVLTTAPQSVFVAHSAAKLALLDRAKDLLVRQGFNETLNFAFSSQAWLSKFGMKSTAKLMNPLSEEVEALVPSLLPGLIQNAQNIWRKHFGSEIPSVRLFEIRPTFHFGGTTGIAAQGEMETGLQEKWKCSFVMAGARLGNGLRNEVGTVDFFDLKAVFEALTEGLGTKGVRLLPLSASRGAAQDPVAALFHPGKSAEVWIGKDCAGYFGLMHPAKNKESKLPTDMWMAELDWEIVSRLSRGFYEAPAFKTWTEQPPMERDFALLVKDDVTAEKLTQIALKAGKPLARSAKIFDVYRGNQVLGGMTSVAVRVIFYDETRSLQESETEAATQQILQAWKKELGVELRN